LNGFLLYTGPAVALFLSGCSAGLPLVYDYSPSQKSSFKTDAPLSAYIEEYADKRAVETPAVLGAITVPSVDMKGPLLALERPVAEAITETLKKELEAAGFRAVSTPEGADYIISGEVRKFSLDIRERDEMEIELHSAIKDKTSVLWSGSTGMKTDRFAGVAGNTRRTVNRFLSDSIQQAVGGIVENAVKLSKTIPPGGGGKLAVTTSPPRAKLRIDGVYYGLTPITVELRPGIYEITLSLKGFEDKKEKLAIRPDSTTELEVSFGE
jgi:hypothetical protein